MIKEKLMLEIDKIENDIISDVKALDTLTKIIAKEKEYLKLLKKEYSKLKG